MQIHIARGAHPGAAIPWNTYHGGSRGSPRLGQYYTKDSNKGIQKILLKKIPLHCLYTRIHIYIYIYLYVMLSFLHVIFLH